MYDSVNTVCESLACTRSSPCVKERMSCFGTHQSHLQPYLQTPAGLRSYRYATDSMYRQRHGVAPRRRGDAQQARGRRARGQAPKVDFCDVSTDILTTVKLNKKCLSRLPVAVASRSLPGQNYTRATTSIHLHQLPSHDS